MEPIAERCDGGHSRGPSGEWGWYGVRLLLLLGCLSVGVVSSAAGQASSVDHRFDEANQAYSSGAYDEAVAAYRRILENGRGGRALYHNLGNAYVRLDSVGAAVWAYEKALQFAPGDRRVRHNLEFIRNREGLPLGGLPARGLAAVVMGWPLAILFWVGLLLVVAGAVMAVRRTPEGTFVPWRDIRVWGLLVAGVIVVLATLGASYLKTLDDRAVVIAEEVPVRPMPDEAGAPDTTLREGGMVEVGDVRGAWLRVRLGDGTTGWTPRRSVRHL